MTDLSKTKDDPRGQLWDKIDEAMAVMVASPDRQQHMQPMGPNVARDENAIWFYTRTDTDLALASVAGGPVHVCVVSKDEDYHACLHGELELIHSREHIERYWNSVVEAWYPEGKNDPALTMLRFRPQSAAIWASTGGTLKFGWEIAKSQMAGDMPDVGTKMLVSFEERALL